MTLPDLTPADILHLIHLRPAEGEERTVDFDEDFSSWGVFGVESGFCYKLCGSKEEAEVFTAKQ